ncbi:SDR family NAD(P)-dependent oxidoreductase [Bacillus sp. ISL-46]|nr:SDR family NAD(P)-dependent oxidoreductase [Bacillus sp. ISL-46]
MVANATPLFGANPFETLSWEEFSGTINGDLKSVFYPTKAVISEMKRQKEGRIVYVSSLPAKKISQGMVSHGVTRSALTTFA